MFADGDPTGRVYLPRSGRRRIATSAGHGAEESGTDDRALGVAARSLARPPAQWHQIVQVALLVVIASYLATTVPGVRPHPGYSWWMDGILQSMAYGAAAALCVVRTPASSPDRTAWRFVAAGLLSLGLSNVHYALLLRALDPMSMPTLSHLLWGIYYVCICVGFVLLTRSRVNRPPFSLWLDGLVVGLGAVTVAAVVAVPELVSSLGGGFAQTAIRLVFPTAGLLLLALAVGAMSLCRWRLSPSLWWLAGGLLVVGFVDIAHVAEAARGTYRSGGVVDAALMIAVTVMALAPGRRERPGIAGVPPTWLPMTLPVLAAAAAISVRVTGRYVQISPVADYLALATMLAALGRLAAASFEARHAGEHAHLAHTDDLTSLLNRRGFYSRAAAILSGKGSSGPGEPACALLLLDLDHFKDVNDSLGHAAGDELLCRVAARLSASLRDEDIVARLGGDEFALLLPGVDADRAVHAAIALISALEQTVVLDGLHVQPDASIGIAVGPEHGRDLGTLLRHADIAMYRAKYAHARYMVYTPDADRHVTTRAGIELLAQLRHAIEHGDLAVHYQPKVRLCSGEMVGVEALVRWHHPDLGLLYPDQFLPLARHNALMQAMTELVVQRALDDAAVWHARGLRIPLAVNLFPPTLADLDLPVRLGHALERHGLTSSALAVEITEEFMLGNLDRARIVLTGLHRLGIRIAIDDFGSGYSSLSYLHELPIDEVKLDRSVIASVTEDPRAAAIVRSVIDLSHTLGLTTVAEGVENPGTAALLTGYGCDIAQGHYFSHPITAEEVLHLYLVTEHSHT